MKMCIVYDVSCKSRKHGPSLNDIECTGPSFNPFLQDISLRFRVYKYTITGDVQKAFFQIDLPTKKHRGFVWIVWVSNVHDIEFENTSNTVLKEFWFQRTIFSWTASLFL